MKLEPTDTRIQVETKLKLSFITANILKEKAGVKVRLPYDLTIPEGTLTLPVEYDGRTITATVDDHEVMIPELIPAGETLAGGSLMFIKIGGVKNQNSVKDAGDFVVETMDNYSGKYYTVDKGTSKTSFIANSGKIISTTPQIDIDNPTNSAKDVTYTLNFKMEDAIPKSGYIRVKFPDTVRLVPPTTRSQGSCRTYNCPIVEEGMIQFLLQDGLAANTPQKLVIGGVINPRSFKPTGEFIMETLDTDAVSLIDEGFKVKV